jgi:SAM-dependent methyltransferase
VTALSTEIPPSGAYEALAPFYDRFTAHHDYELWVSGLLRIARRHGFAGKRALDAACGTGKSFLPLLRRGFEVTACDSSQPMLDVAADKVDGRVPLHRRDLRELESLGEFDLVTCLDDVANYLTSPDDLAAALRGLRRNLRPGGMLVFDANTIATYRGFFRETSVVDHPGLVMVWRGLADEAFGAGDLATAALDVFCERSEGCWVRTTSFHEQRHHPQLVVRDCIEASGLTLVAVYGQDPAVNFETEVDERRHSKAVYLATCREPCP